MGGYLLHLSGTRAASLSPARQTRPLCTQGHAYLLHLIRMLDHGNRIIIPHP
jgi:hypothetical protein